MGTGRGYGQDRCAYPSEAPPSGKGAGTGKSPSFSSDDPHPEAAARYPWADGSREASVPLLGQTRVLRLPAACRGGGRSQGDSRAEAQVGQVLMPLEAGGGSKFGEQNELFQAF